MTTRRLFVAVPLSAHVLAALERLQEELRPALPGVGWVRREGMHVTLQFLGDVEEAQAEIISAALSRAAARPPFDADCAGFGVFPDAKRARVIWAGMTKGANEMRRLQKSVEEELKPLGFAPERRDFTPHVTIGRIRFREDARAMQATLDAHASDEHGAFRVESFSLFESLLRPEGAEYRTVETFLLRGGV